MFGVAPRAPVDLMATFKLSILPTLIVDNDLSALDGNDGRPNDAPLLDGLEAQTLKPSGLAVDQFGDYAGVARVARGGAIRPCARTV